MDLDEEGRLIHEPVRLKVMALLHQRGEVSAAAARATLALTPGNLESHAKRLEGAGLLMSRKVLGPDGFEARLRITTPGVAAFERYLAWLEDLVAASKATGVRTPG